MLTILTPAATDDLTTLAKAKAEIGVTGTADDDHVLDLIRRASGACARFCARTTFGRETLRQTERLDSGRCAIVLDRDLAPTISTVTVDGTTLAGTEYELDGAMLYRLSSDKRIWWSAGSKVVIEYDAGYTLLGSLPDDVEQACLLTVSAWWASRGRDSLIRSESVEGVGETSYFEQRTSGVQAIAPSAEGLLAPWRVVTV